MSDGIVMLAPARPSSIECSFSSTHWLDWKGAREAGDAVVKADEKDTRDGRRASTLDASGASAERAATIRL